MCDDRHDAVNVSVMYAFVNRLFYGLECELMSILDYWSWCPNSSRMATIHCLMADLTVWLMIASAASNMVRWQYFCTFWLVNIWKAKIYKCKACLVIKNQTQGNLPTRREARVCNDPWGHDMVCYGPWGILGPNLGSYRFPYLRSFYPEKWSLEIFVSTR